MPHPKKRTNTIVKVYKFGANPLEKLPDEFWQTAKQMQFVWNDLVRMRNKLTDNFERIGVAGKDSVKLRIPYWKEFDKVWREYLKSEKIKSILGNDEREFILQKFETADKRAKQEKTGLKPQFTLDRIYFRHRFSGGGKPLEKFKTQKGGKFSFLFPTENHYGSNKMIHRKKRIGAGVFGCVKDGGQIFSFPFSAVIHREIPLNAIVKSVSWVGKRLKNRNRNGDWIWSIDISVEIPAPDLIESKIGRIAALDVGWRKIDDNFLRLGVILDSDGNKFEIRVPIYHESNAVKDGKLAASLAEIIKIDEQKGNLVQSTKDKLAELGVKNLTKMREGGLFRLKNQTEDKQVLEVLEQFVSEFIPLSSRRIRSFDRLNKYRDWLYQNLASWLAQNYDSFIWEGKLNLKKMAEDRKDLNKAETQTEKDSEKIRRKSAKYRNFASLYNFRDCLKKAFDKKGKTIIDGITPYSSRKCSECGEIVEKFANIEFVCPNGHNFDRDFNAVQNLLNQVEDFEVMKGEILVVPEQLKTVVRLQ